jgi:hypothetical protein
LVGIGSTDLNHQTKRRVFLCCLLLLAATSATAQVQVDGHRLLMEGPVPHRGEHFDETGPAVL